MEARGGQARGSQLGTACICSDAQRSSDAKDSGECGPLHGNKAMRCNDGNPSLQHFVVQCALLSALRGTKFPAFSSNFTVFLIFIASCAISLTSSSACTLSTLVNEQAGGKAMVDWHQHHHISHPNTHLLHELSLARFIAMLHRDC